MKGKRLLAVLLATLMTASSVSITAFAETVEITEDGANVGEEQAVATAVVNGKPCQFDSLNAAIESADNDSTITLCNDITAGKDDFRYSTAPGTKHEYYTLATIKDKKITLDLKGKTISIANGTDFKESTPQGYGTIIRIFRLNQGADLTITGEGAIRSNGNVSTDNDASYAFSLRNNSESEKASLTIKSGTIEGLGEVIYCVGAHNSIVIEGGTFANYITDKTHMLNGQNGTCGGKCFVIRGGTFIGVNPAEMNDGNLCAPGYVPTADANGNYSVAKATDGVASAVVGGEALCFDSLQEAVDNADNDSTITILSDIEIEVPAEYYTKGSTKYGERFSYVTVNNKKLTFDFDNHKISLSDNSKANLVADANMFMWVYNNSDITFTGNGEIEFDCGNDSIGCYIVWLRGMANSYNYLPSKLTVENGTYKSQNIFYVSGTGDNGYNKGGEITINGGTFASIRNNNGYNQYINVAGNTMTDNKRVTIKGGTFDVDPRYYQDNWGSVVNGAADSYMVDSSKYSVAMKTVNGKKEFSIVSNDDVVATVNTTLTESMKPYIGMDMWGKVQGLTYSYTSLADAIANANDGDTVKLLANASGDGIVIDKDSFGENGITIDLGGFTYTVGGKAVGSSITMTNGFQFIEGNKITVKNGTLTTASTVTCRNANGDYDAAAFTVIINYSDLTLDNVTLDGSKLRTTGYTLSNNSGNVNINNSKITANGGYAFDICDYASYPGATVTVDANSVIDGKVEISDRNGGEMTGKIVDFEGTEYTKVGTYIQKQSKFELYLFNTLLVVTNKDIVTVDGEECYPIQLFAGIDNLSDYTNAGFKLIAKRTGYEPKTITASTNTLYTSMTVTNDSGTKKKYEPSDFGGEYIFGHQFFFKVSEWNNDNTELVVAAYATKKDSTGENTIWGPEKTISKTTLGKNLFKEKSSNEEIQ